MSEVNLNFSVAPVEANLVITTNDITFTPTPISMTLYAGGIGTPGGNVSTVQYNAGGVLGGIDSVTSTGSSISFANVANLKISGGVNGQVIKTDGAGNLSFGTSVGGTNTQLQYNNNGDLNGIPNVTYALGNLTLGNVANVKMTGGTNGQFIKTDGAGNLSYGTAITSPGGSNTQIQYNNAGFMSGASTVTYVNGTLNLGPVANVKMTGGTNGYVLATDGFGVLSWSPQAGGSGNGVPNGQLYTMQYNAGNGKFFGSNNFTYTPTVETINIQQVAENFSSNAIPATGLINFDLIGPTIVLKTANATGNFQLNFRGNSLVTTNDMLNIGGSLTCTFINKNGATAYYANSFSIDGTTITPSWFAGTPVGLGTINSYNSYTFNIMKTAANTYTFFATAAQYS